MQGRTLWMYSQKESNQIRYRDKSQLWVYFHLEERAEKLVMGKVQVRVELLRHSSLTWKYDVLRWAS
eukprot:5317049-Amphidinium_carterae.1